MSGFFQALPFVLEMEGGYVNDPDDRGGATNKGITQVRYDAWRQGVGLEPRPVRSIQDDEVTSIYHSMYWVVGKCDALPWPASLVHFDACVNHGPHRAAVILQDAVDVIADGKIGPKTLAAVEAMDVRVLCYRMLLQRVEFYYDISTGRQVKFLRGWLRRVIHLRDAA